MKLSSIIQDYFDGYSEKYGDSILPGHRKALNAICRCRTKEAGELYVTCPKCHLVELRPVSCGHRHCPQCQNHEADKWIDRQLNKRLPVRYFMVTFTLPYEFRSVAYQSQRKVYSTLFDCSAATLKDFGKDPKHLGADIGMTLALHTHNRKLDFHPHIHAVVPGGGINKSKRQWIKKKGKYLFNQSAMAKVFRAKFIDAMNQAGLPIPRGVTPKWVVHCKQVGSGITALKYLSRYLYRGVISERNIVSNRNGQVTFKYTESKTGEIRYRTLRGEDFLRLITRHVLPKGFRRVRDYGFLHSNAKRILSLVQMVLYVLIENVKLRPRPAFLCPCCKSPMTVVGFKMRVWNSG